jgi:glutamate synthase domain-containing protein 2
MRSLRVPILALTTGLTVLALVFAAFDLRWLLLAALAGPLAGLAWRDALQTADNVRRSFPILGSIKAGLQDQRQILQEVAIENAREGRPFDDVQRRIIHKRADDRDQHLPFGTEYDYARPGHDWLLHSAWPTVVDPATLRVTIGSRRPYSASLLNVSGMSYGSISPEAIRALGRGAKLGRFAVNTGEGGMSAFHLEAGNDVVFQFGTGYFGCRTKDGRFDPAAFQASIADDAVKMVEIKISQGAKPGFGAILPASKNTADIARIRGIEPGVEVRSPAGHTAFRDADELLDFVERLRELAGGRPVGVKLCVGRPAEIEELCRKMADTGRGPDYVAVDGGEGGSGAAALDAAAWVGMPLQDALVVVADAFDAHGLRPRVRLLAAGKVASGFDVVRLLALGADAVCSARAMMMALGCVQALKCDTNHCPTGVTTLDPRLRAGLDVIDKSARVAAFHRNTLAGVAQLLGAAGLRTAGDLRREHIARRTGPGEVRTLAQLHPPVAGAGAAKASSNLGSSRDDER